MDQLDNEFLNNSAVEFMRRGDLVTAADLLRQALLRTQGHSELNISSGSESSTSESDSPQLRLSFSQEVGLPQSMSQPHTQMQQSTSRSGDASIYLHTQGISLTSGNGLAYSSDPLINLSIVSSITIYNFGLVHQLQGLNHARYQGTKELLDSIGSRKFLTHRALNLYSRSVMILEEAGFVSNQATSLPVLDFLFMAVFNNVGYSDFVQGDYSGAMANFQHLEALAGSVKSISLSQQWDFETCILMDEYMKTFLLNVMVLREPILAATA
jgi:hypothetical protein